MPKEFCSDCKGPREPESTQGSYCIKCTRARARARYRKLREEAGYVVAERNNDVDHRKKYLNNMHGKPGQCEVCGEQELDSLCTVHTGDLTKEEAINIDRPLALFCKPCRSLTKTLTPEQFARVVRIGKFLEHRQIPFTHLAPDFTDLFGSTF